MLMWQNLTRLCMQGTAKKLTGIIWSTVESLATLDYSASSFLSSKNKKCDLTCAGAKDVRKYVLPDRSRAMPPVRTLLFLVPLVKALRPSTTPAKQLSTASSIKARVASQKAAKTTQTPQQLGVRILFIRNFVLL